MSPTTRPALQRARTLLGMPMADKYLIVKVYVLLGVAKFAIRVLSFQRLERYLGTRHIETPFKTTREKLLRAKKIGWTIRTVSPFTPWESNCLPQAMCAKKLLRDEGIPSTLYMGVAFKPEGGALQGHAWLRCGPLYVTGGNSHSEFGAVASFGEASEEL